MNDNIVLFTLVMFFIIGYFGLSRKIKKDKFSILYPNYYDISSYQTEVACDNIIRKLFNKYLDY